MSVQVTIEAASKAEAELIARELPLRAEAHSWRGFGVIRLVAKNRKDVQELIDGVSRVFHAHELHWTRVRYDDEERVFKVNGRKAADQSTGSACGSARPAMR